MFWWSLLEFNVLRTLTNVTNEEWSLEGCEGVDGVRDGGRGCFTNEFEESLENTKTCCEDNLNFRKSYKGNFQMKLKDYK